MAKRATKTADVNGNGSRPKGREDINQRAAYVAKHYAPLYKAINAMAQQFENVTPADARFVSGFIRSVAAIKCDERRGEFEAFRKQERVKRDEEKAAKMRAWLKEHESLKKSLNA